MLSTKTKEVIGHAHVVIQSIPSLNSTAVLDPANLYSSKELKAHVAQNLSINRLGSMLTAANHQPVLAGIAQRGLLMM
ncbi:hypothetical protein KEM48_004696, partial [Puccinia striiformis f. sp. tritici PST-130]